MKKCWFDGATVIITGASSGIGKDVATLLIKEHGCKVIGIARNEERLIKFRESLGSFGDAFTYRTFDVSEKQNWENFAGDLVKEGIRADILINNAGILPKFDKFSNYGIDEIERAMNINFYSCVYSMKYLMPLIQESTRGGIINIASSAALCSLAGTSVYSASKAALKRMTDAIREEYRNELYVGLVCPGFTKTNIFCNQEVTVEGAAEKAINLISTDCEKMAFLIVDGMKHKRGHMVFGIDAHMMDIGDKLVGTVCSRLSSAVMKLSGVELFKKVFE